MTSRDRRERPLTAFKRSARASLIGVIAVTAVAATVVLVPVAAAQAAEPPVAVDVDLVEGGVWVTYSNGCIESRAWQVPLDDDDNWYRADGNRQCVVGKHLNGPNNLFYFPRVIRAPLAVGAGERVVALVPTNGDEGYWLVTTTGRVVTGGSARSLGDLSAYVLNAPVVAAAPTESGNGYYMLTGDGGVFSFGDAQFYGSVQGLVDEHVGFGALAADHITAPVVTLATTPAGYWLVAADGAVFPFGDAAYHGSIQDVFNPGTSLGDITRDWILTPNVSPGAGLAKDNLDKPVVGVVPSGGGTGYQMVASDGGIFTFGAAQFHGALPGRGGSNSLAVSSDVTESRSGYVILTDDGTVHRFGAIGRQLDPVGRPATALTPTALPASECRPAGEQGFPFHQSSAHPIGALDIGVLFVEFDDYRTDQQLWPRDRLQSQLATAERYMEAMSYGELDVRLHANYEWLSVGAFRAEYQEPRPSGGIGLGGAELLDSIIRRSAGSFDFSNRGLGFDGIMVVFPPSWFGGGLAWTQYEAVPAGITTNAVAWTNTVLRDQRATSRQDWWTTAAHEIMHLPGLDDLYAYDSSSHQAPSGWRTTQYGLFRFSTFWPATPEFGWSSGRITLANGRSFVDDYYTFARQRALEMLGWHRWRLGWLKATQVACLAFGSASIDLKPIAEPSDGVAMVALKVSDTLFLVLERRERIGFDADRQGCCTNTGSSYYYRGLDHEGVLAYFVDVAVGSGELPVRLFAEGAELRDGQNWILNAGGWASSSFSDGTTLRIDVSDGPGGTSRVQITTS